MGEGIVILIVGIPAALLIAACGRGIRIPGPTWFDVIRHWQHPTNRRARRAHHLR